MVNDPEVSIVVEAIGGVGAALAMVRKAATEVPQMGYIGWDVAFSVNGPLLIEGNDFPGHDIYQLPEHTPDKLGMMPKFRV